MLVFPNIKTEASYDFLNQAITLNSLKLEDYMSFIENKDFLSLSKQMSIISHELTHWADVISTLWGRKIQTQLYECLNLIMHDSKDDKGLYPLFKFNVNRIMMEKCSEVKQKGDFVRNWELNFGAAAEVNNDILYPYIIINFMNRATKEIVAKQPLSAGALLETNAVYSELINEIQFLKCAGFDGYIEHGEVMRSYMRFLYDPNLTLYTAPAHLLSSKTGCKEMIFTYEVCSYISNIVLNLNDDLYSSIKKPDIAGDCWNELIPHFISNHDVGYAFFCVVMNLTPWKQDVNMVDWVNNALNKTGLPTAKEILLIAEKHLLEQRELEVDEKLKTAHDYLCSIGIVIFKERSSKVGLSVAEYSESKITLLPPYNSDAEDILLGGKFDENQFNREFMHSLGGKLFTAIKDFP